MKDCTTCKYGFVDEQFGFPMCHHPKRFFEDCVDFNMHEEVEESEKATGVEEKKLPDGLEEAAEKYRRDSCNAAMIPNIDGPMPEYGGSVKDAFKAGAEWAAGQGESVEIYVNEEDGYDFHYDLGGVMGTLDLQNLGLYKKGGVNQDDLIVQIRKK